MTRWSALRRSCAAATAPRPRNVRIMRIEPCGGHVGGLFITSQPGAIPSPRAAGIERPGSSLLRTTRRVRRSDRRDVVCPAGPPCLGQRPAGARARRRRGGRSAAATPACRGAGTCGVRIWSRWTRPVYNRRLPRDPERAARASRRSASVVAAPPFAAGLAVLQAAAPFYHSRRHRRQPVRDVMRRARGRRGWRCLVLVLRACAIQLWTARFASSTPPGNRSRVARRSSTPASRSARDAGGTITVVLLGATMHASVRMGHGSRGSSAVPPSMEVQRELAVRIGQRRRSPADLRPHAGARTICDHGASTLSERLGPWHDRPLRRRGYKFSASTCTSGARRPVSQTHGPRLYRSSRVDATASPDGIHHPDANMAHSDRLVLVRRRRPRRLAARTWTPSVLPDAQRPMGSSVSTTTTASTSRRRRPVPVLRGGRLVTGPARPPRPAGSRRWR